MAGQVHCRPPELEPADGMTITTLQDIEHTVIYTEQHTIYSRAVKTILCDKV